MDSDEPSPSPEGRHERSREAETESNASEISLHSPDRVANLHRFASPPKHQERIEETDTEAFDHEETEDGEDERPRSQKVTLYMNSEDYNLTLGAKKSRTMGWFKNKTAEFFML